MVVVQLYFKALLRVVNANPPLGLESSIVILASFLQLSWWWKFVVHLLPPLVDLQRAYDERK